MTFIFWLNNQNLSLICFIKKKYKNYHYICDFSLVAFVVFSCLVINHQNNIYPKCKGWIKPNQYPIGSFYIRINYILPPKNFNFSHNTTLMLFLNKLPPTMFVFLTSYHQKLIFGYILHYLGPNLTKCLLIICCLSRNHPSLFFSSTFNLLSTLFIDFHISFPCSITSLSLSSTPSKANKGCWSCVNQRFECLIWVWASYNEEYNEKYNEKVIFGGKL